jgi:phosphoketolase
MWAAALVASWPSSAGIWRWASNYIGDPEVVMAYAGYVPAFETLAAVTNGRAKHP